jgi:ethanolamine kinase
VIGHCDLLSANVIIPSSDPSVEQDGNPDPANMSSNSLAGKVHFIDYEYAVPCPAAFDLANHFSEWGGFDCDYNMLPTQATRRTFIEEYVQSHGRYAPVKTTEIALSMEQLCHDVDRYRGMPGFYWGVQALIQDTISDVDFDWTSYAEVRLAEFWAWRREVEGTRAQAGEQIPLRERRWAQQA